MKLFIVFSGALGFVLLAGGNQYGIIGYLPWFIDGLINLVTEEVAD
jgi:hypothetical protein